MLVTSVISFGMDEGERQLLLQWFQKDSIVTREGETVNIVQLTKKHKHALVKKIFSAKSITESQKLSVMEALEKFDQSDMLGKTKAFCQSAVPDIVKKREAWEVIFSDKLDKESLLIVNEYCAGFKQFSQRDLLEEFADDFFIRIEQVVATKAASKSETIYLYLQPNMLTSDASIGRFENFLHKIQASPPGETTERLVKWVKDSIFDMKQKKVARDLSEKWEALSNL